MLGSQTVVTVVVNWNLRADLAECLDSLVQSTYRDHQIIVVDNNSSDDSVSYVHLHYPNVIVMELPENRGYARALNAAIACALSAGAGYIFALNNDTIVPPDTIGKLVRLLSTGDRIGLVSPKTLVHRQPDLLYGLGDRRSAWLPLPKAYGYGWRDKPGYDGPMEFDYVTGCAMLIPCHLFRQVGMFDESLFLFYEDSDFCRRVRDHGWRIVCAGDTPIYHKVSQSTGGTNEGFTLRIRARNRIRFYRRYRHGPSPALTMLTIVAIAFWRVFRYALKRRHLVRPYVEGLLAGWHEPVTSPVYTWPLPPCPGGAVIFADRTGHGP